MADENTTVDTKVEETKAEEVAKDEAKAKPKRERPERDNKPVEFVAQPDQAEFNITVNKLDRGVEAINKKIEQLNVQIKNSGDVRQEFRNQKKEVIEKLRTIKKQKEALYNERNVHQEKVVAIETERKTRREKTSTLRASLKFLKVEEIDKAVAAIEYRLSTTQLTLKKEKELIQEIKELKAQKDVVRQYEEAKNHEDAETFDTKELREKRDAKNKEIRVVRDAEQEHQAKLLDLRNKENAVNDKIKAYVVERRNCNSEVRDLRKESAKVKIEFERQTRAHKRYVDYTAWVKRNEARARRQERIEADKKWRAEQAARENGEEDGAEDDGAEPKVKAHPYEKEMFLIGELSRYLRRIAPQDGDNAADTRTNEEKASDDKIAEERNAKFKGKQGVVLKPAVKAMKGDFFPGTGGKKSKKKKRKGLSVLTHIPDVFAQFASLNIEIPMDVSAVPKALKALDEKNEYFKTAPPPMDNKEKKKLAAKQAKEANAKGDAEAAEEEKKEREAAKERAKAMVAEEQARRVKEAADGDESAEADRKKATADVIAATEAERARVLAEAKASEDKAAAESAAAKAEADKATKAEQEEQIAEFSEKKRRKSIVQEVMEAQKAAADATAGQSDA